MTPGTQAFWRKLRLTLEMIKFEHSVFALPFALTGALLAFREDGFAAPGLRLEAAVDRGGDGGGALGGMAFNRAGRRRYRRAAIRAPRSRHLPAGLLTRGFAWGFVAVSALVFLLAACALNPLCLRLAPVALASCSSIRSPSDSRRCRTWCSASPRHRAGRRLDRGPRLARPAHPLAHRRSHVLDRRLRHHLLLPGLRVRSARRAVQRAAAARDRRRAVGGAAAAPGHARVPAGAGAGVRTWPLALAGVAAVAALLMYEHSLVQADDLSRVDAAFFTMNGYVSVLFFCFGLLIFSLTECLNACSHH